MMAILLAVVMALPACASAEGIRIDGKIEAVRTQTILAPHSGRVGDYAVRVGDELNAGDELFTLSAQTVGEQCEVHFLVATGFGCLFHSFELVFKD